MISYARWKIALVAIVVALGILLALPNLFGEESALQLARDRAAVQASDRDRDRAAAAIQGRQADRRVPRPGPPHAALRQQARPAEGARRHRRGAARTSSPSRSSQASRVPDWMRSLGLSPLKLGLDLRGGVYLVYQVDVAGAVKQLLDHREQDFRASLAQRPRALSGRAGGLSAATACACCSATRTVGQGQGRHPRGQPQPAS